MWARRRRGQLSPFRYAKARLSSLLHTTPSRGLRLHPWRLTQTPYSLIIQAASLLLFFDQLGELVEKVSGVMRPGRRFGMILDTEDR